MPTHRATECADHLQKGVLRLGARNDDGELSRLNTIGCQGAGIGFQYLVTTVGNHGDFAIAHTRCQVVLDFRMIGNEVIAPPAPHTLVKPEPGFGYRTPLIPPPLNTIHIDDIGLPLETLHQVENGGVVAKSKK
ncbi:hypothetical protein D3C78_1485420 [compost metagenome]